MLVKADYRHYLTYFGEEESELRQLFKNEKGRVREGALAVRLFSQPGDQITRLFPLFRTSIERLKADWEWAQVRGVRYDYLKFDKGAPTWQRLAWKCWMAWNENEVAGKVGEECRADVCAFLARHDGAIQEQDRIKREHTAKVKEILPNEEYFPIYCGKPNVRVPYATNKILAKNIFKIDDRARFSELFDYYITQLMKATVHPDIAQDLLEKLVETAAEEWHAKHDWISDNGRELLERAKEHVAKK